MRGGPRILGHGVGPRERIGADMDSNLSTADDTDSPGVHPLLALAAVVVFGAIMVLGFHLVPAIQDAARAQACEKIAAGEQAPELLPGSAIECPAER